MGVTKLLYKPVESGMALIFGLDDHYKTLPIYIVFILSYAREIVFYGFLWYCYRYYELKTFKKPAKESN